MTTDQRLLRCSSKNFALIKPLMFVEVHVQILIFGRNVALRVRSFMRATSFPPNKPRNQITVHQLIPLVNNENWKKIVLFEKLTPNKSNLL